MHRAELRPESCVRHTLVKAGDDAGQRVAQRAGDCSEIMPLDAHVAVGEHDYIVARRFEHVLQIGDLAVGAAGPRIDDERDVVVGQVADEGAGGRQRTILGIINAEDDLPRGVILLGKRSKVLVKVWLIAMQRLQHRHRRRVRRARQRAPDKPANGAGRPD